MRDAARLSVGTPVVRARVVEEAKNFPALRPACKLECELTDCLGVLGAAMTVV